ncbi:MAG TPA: hypothetical protein QF813_09220 [Alphaproteobacteria bacterium]|nr:hypothetical protein [Alphaproteobacteria bacterium]
MPDVDLTILDANPLAEDLSAALRRHAMVRLGTSVGEAIEIEPHLMGMEAAKYAFEKRPSAKSCFSDSSRAMTFSSSSLPWSY